MMTGKRKQRFALFLAKECMINKLELLTDEPVVDVTMKSHGSHGSKYKLSKNTAKQIEYNCTSIISIIKRSHVSLYLDRVQTTKNMLSKKLA
jgi:hypothetical protein